ncbi:glycosyltransferase [Streptomyces canus]|uniref:glycosyltransferase n=1 Tax=Streptomyces canus TaxID=58343 RepID=UPI002E2AC297|nr:glycosyltransferase [Streptomyces canus]
MCGQPRTVSRSRRPSAGESLACVPRVAGVAAADAFAFPSLKEGFGLAAMEALAAGVPLVLRDLPVLREVFGPAARFAATPDDLADQLGRALTHHDPALRTAGRELAARHTWSQAARRHLDFHRTLG